MNFLELYPKTPDDCKLKFLNAIIHQNDTLQKEFVAFVHRENEKMPGLSYDNFLELINSIETEYQYSFEMVDLQNPDWDNYHPPHSGYIEEWEAYQLASQQEFEAILDNFRSDATDRIIRQKADELIAMLIGLYGAIMNTELNDEFCSFEDVNDYLIKEHTNVMNGLIEKIRISAVSDSAVLNTFEMFFSYFGSRYQESPQFANHFEHLLISLAEKSGYADRLVSIIDQSAVEEKFLPELVLLLNKKSGNIKVWLQIAEQFYNDNTAVAKHLLEYYFETDKDAFIKTARELFNSDKYLWAEFLQQYVSLQLNKDLFVEIYRQLVIRTSELEYYNKIRNHLSEAELADLINELKYNKAFIVQILEVEERYEDIKSMVEQNPDDWYYADIIAPILTVYPEFCFKHIKNRAKNTLQNNRGRSVYERIVSWLLLTKQIPGYDIGRRELINQIYSHKPNLPALRDEMRKAGLVK
ncbi:MAG: hypothetical protein P1P82_04445 [Bacteroidales bacterium]|nr:hypothetical protein [Bacteroidales bacterium]MDT8432051.1 hypothetical protein [Bacteroidales bacterium]